jgi:PAS domain S-box-containing protein
MIFRLLLAISLPFFALALQWVAWPWIAPFVWFLFFPAVFFSARLGGLWGGVTSSILSTGIVWYFFMPPQLSWALDKPSSLYSIILFLIMGCLFSDSQERLRRAQVRTEAALGEARTANATISQLYQKTLELDELKEQFFANISHELRTPLTLIISPLMRRLAIAEKSEAARREDEMMLRNARILYRHVSDLLDVSKLEAGQMSGDFARVDLCGLVRQVAAQFEVLAQERGIDYRLVLPPQLEAEVDGEKVQRILLNLLSNAFKFVPDGARVEVRLYQQDGEAVLEVQDNGSGVPEAMRETVFERFRQAEGSAHRRFGGTGLGLAIVKEFAELHGGGARVVEAPGGGALFIIRLSLHAPPGAIIQKAANRLDPIIDHQVMDENHSFEPGVDPEMEGQAEPDVPLVLVIEDNVDMSAFISELLRPHYRVAKAFDGREGLARALALQPDLILCDVMMPQLSGDQLVQELRQNPAMDDVPIVMLSAKTEDALRVRLFKSGIQDFINKPFVADEMLARVEGLISERKKAKAVLRSSRLSYRSLFENMINGYAHCQMLFEHGKPKDFIYLDVNKAFEDQTGLHDVVGRKVSEVIPGIFESSPELLEIYGRVATSGEPARFDFYVEALMMWFSISVYSPQPEHFVALFDVVTERKKAELALKESEGRYRALVEQSLAGIYIIQDGRFRYVNPGFAEIFGYDSPDALIDTVAVTDLVASEDRERVAVNLNQRIEGALAEKQYIFVGMRRDDRRISVEAYGRAFAYQGCPAVIGLVLDITARQAAENALRRQTQELEERNQELERFNRASVGRELDMIALKRQINELSRQLGRDSPHALSFVGSSEPASDAEI